MDISSLSKLIGATLDSQFLIHKREIFLLSRYSSDTAHAALDVLSIVTLAPYSHRAVVSAQLSSDDSRSGMSIILDAAGGQAFSDPEIIAAALGVLVHVVCPPPALAKPFATPQVSFRCSLGSGCS